MTDTQKVQVLRDHEGHVKKHVKKINRHRFLSSEDIEELENDLRMRVWRSLERYDERLGSLSGWVVQSLYLEGARFLRDFFRKGVQWENSAIPMSAVEVAYSDGTGGEEDFLQSFAPTIDAGFLKVDDDDFIERIQNRRYAEMLKEILDGSTLKEIGERRGVTPQAVRDYMVRQRPTMKRRL